MKVKLFYSLCQLVLLEIFLHVQVLSSFVVDKSISLVENTSYDCVSQPETLKLVQLPQQKNSGNVDTSNLNKNLEAHSRQKRGVCRWGSGSFCTVFCYFKGFFNGGFCRNVTLIDNEPIPICTCHRVINCLLV